MACSGRAKVSHRHNLIRRLRCADTKHKTRSDQVGIEANSQNNEPKRDQNKGAQIETAPQDNRGTEDLASANPRRTACTITQQQDKQAQTEADPRAENDH